MKAMMKSIDGYPMRWLVAASVLAMVLMLPQAGFGQQAATASGAKAPAALSSPIPSAATPGAAPARPAAKPNGEEEESPKPNTAGHQGVHVHGHWVLQVKNADGTLGKRLEFENSLVTDEVQTSGDEYLVGVLSGNLTPGDPGIAFLSYSSPAAATANPPSSASCSNNIDNSNTAICYVFTTPTSLLHIQDVISSPNGIADGLVFTTNFRATANSTKPGWVLSGNYTVPTGLTYIWAVQTLATFCGPYADNYYESNATNALIGSTTDRQADAAPINCAASNPIFSGAGSNNEFAAFATLTSTLVPNAPMTVTPGQIITVTVTLSFS